MQDPNESKSDFSVGRENQQIVDSNSPESLKQHQNNNPNLLRMQILKERQQKILGEQLKNQEDFNQKNLVVDSDV